MFIRICIKCRKIYLEWFWRRCSKCGSKWNHGNFCSHECYELGYEEWFKQLKHHNILQINKGLRLIQGGKK